LEEKARLQREKAIETYGQDASKPLERDFETMRRRNEILTKIKNRKKTQAMSASQMQSYKQVVREYDLPAFDSNPIKALLQKLLISKSRKLKPVVKAPESVAFNNLA
jgi:hypothetical protein